MGVRANNYGLDSTMPPDNPSRRVDMVDWDDVAAKVKDGQKVALCRCYRSAKFPYCDGSHIKHNEETGDNIAPVVVTSGLDAAKRGLDFTTQVRPPCFVVPHVVQSCPASSAAPAIC